MSSWYVFSALGFYPLGLASGNYVIGSPLYDSVTVHHGDSTLTIKADGNTKNTPYVSDVKLDGAEHTSAYLPQAALEGDHTLTFTMSDKAGDWGSTSDTSKKRTPLADATSDQGSALLASDQTNVSALADDNSRTSATLTDEHASVGWTSVTGQVQVASYTVTNGAATGGTPSSAPSSWKLKGSNDGTTWTTVDERSDQKFAWATQTRPFSVKTPGLYQNYQLEITGTSDGTPATMAEIELLVDPTSQGDLAIHPQSSGANSGVAYSGGYAVVRGGSSDVADYQASVDFLDGKGPQTATVTAARLGGVQVTLPHTFASAGTYAYVVSVTVGAGADAVTLSTNGTVAVKTARSFTDAFDNACLTTSGTAVDCDGNGYGLPKTSLATAGFAQGSTIQVGSTGLSFSLPQTADGKPDNATSNGQVVRLQLGEGATKIAFIGFANEGQQSGTGTITYDDGTTQDVQIAFGDWTGAASSPISGNTIVATITGRQSGSSGSDSTKTSVYATTPVSLKEGAVPVTFTLPNLNHSLKQGELHIFAIADDGTAKATDPISLSASSVDEQAAGRELNTQLAAVSGGLSPKTAMVYWGDNTPTSEASVSDGAVSGKHTYAVAGDYTAVVTVDDGLSSKAVEVPITVVPAWEPKVKLADATVDSGSTLAVTGSGFKTGESVSVSLSTDPVVSTTVTADGSGAISASLVVPKRTADGTYVVTALGAHSATPATADLVVRTNRDATSTTLAASPVSAKYGTPVTLTATVSGDAAGAVQFLDGSRVLGLSALAGGKATLVTDSLGAGSHALRATFGGDKWHAGSSSGTVTVTITRAAVSLTAPKLSATKVIWGASTAVLSTTVTGLTEGSSISFVSGKRTIAVGQVAKTSSGTVAKAAVSTSVPAGTYRNIKAVWSGDTNHTAATSPASSKSLTVVKAKPTSIKVVKGSFTKGTQPKVLVLMGRLTNGQWPVGTVSVHASGLKTVKVKLSSSMAGMVTVTLSKSKKSVKVWAQFRPSDTKHVSSATSKKVTYKAR